MKGGTTKVWLSADVQAFFEWINAVTQMRAKSPMEMASAKAQLLSGPEGERQCVFGNGSQDYMMQRYKNLAMIQVSGTLVKNDSPWNKYYGLVSYDEIRRSALLALQDRSVDGILLQMNTPGGSAAGADAMAGFFSKTNKTKPLYAFAESDMCSGGYYLGAPAREVYAQRAAQVGSIGVIMVHYDYLKMYLENGVTPTVFRAGEFKALGSSMEHLDKKAIANIESTLGDYFKMFNDHVVEHRGYDSAEQMRATAGEGRVFMAEEAKEVGLVDQVMELEDALEEISGKAAKLAGRSTQAYVVNTQSRGSNMSRAAQVAAAKAKADLAGSPLSEAQVAALAAGLSLGDAAQADALALAGSEGDAPAAELTAEEIAAKALLDAGGDEPAAVVAAEPVAAGVAAAPVGAVDLSQVIALSTELGTVKAELKSMQAATAAIQAEAAGKDALITSLQSVAVIAINNRQTALGFQPSDAGSLSPQQCCDTFAQLDSDFKARFKPGAKTSATQAAVEPATLTPTADAARGMTGKL